MRLIDADELLKLIPHEEACSSFAVANAPTIEPQRWIPCEEQLPKENAYVLVWCGEVKIARIIRGISKEQRIKMKEGTIDDPISYGWNLSNGYFKVKRSESYRTCDENGNNKVPYCWDCIYGKMFGQDVKAWMPLPKPYAERRTE
jgi:hypothetical protein